MDQVEGVQLGTLEDEVVEHIECEERRVQEHARIGVFAEALVVVNSS